MKILELRLKNLNSLYGEWRIDFTDPEYVSNGIFALTGPTGAGKSTILDAICLALYGATPRLGKITKNSNEVMSRQTGECYAEVVFESQAGRYRCHWEQRKARKSPTGKLQDQEHQIADADTDKLIETKKSLVVSVIEEKTGMDFDRFTRSILLAQGGFDTFLKADIEQKSKILEQITGTEIYSEISMRVHERHREERDKLNLIQAETSGIVIMEPEREKETQLELEEKQRQAQELTSKAKITGEAITWLTTISRLKNEINNLSDEAEKLQVEVEAFKPKRSKLDQATKAALLDGVFATLTALRKQLSDDQLSLEAEQAALPQLEISANSQTEVLNAAEQLTIEVKDNVKAAAPLIQKIRLLDQKIADQFKSVKEGSEHCSKEAEKIDSNKQTRMNEQRKRTEAEKSLAISEQYLKEHLQDEWLISGLAGIEEQVSNLLARQKDIGQKKTDLKHADTAIVVASKKLDVATKQCVIYKQELEEAANNLHQGKGFLSKLLGDKLLREYRTEKENQLREIAYIRKIEELENHRAKLEDGKPCPLCGSLEHPFAEGNIPLPDEIEQRLELLTELITKAEDQEVAISKLVGVEAVVSKKLNDSEKLEASAVNEKKTAEKDFSELTDTLEKLQLSFEELKRGVSQKLLPFGILKVPESDILSLVGSLKSRLKVWQEQVGQKSAIEKQIALINSEIKRLGAVIETQDKALTEKQDNLNRLKKEHAADTDERNSLYGTKVPDEEESRLNKAIADAEEADKKARTLNAEFQQKLTSATTHIDSLLGRIEHRAPDLKNTEVDFLVKLKSAGFAEEEHFLEARLNNEELELLSTQAKKLDDTLTELRVRQKDREIRLSIEVEKKVTDLTLTELEPKIKEYEESLSKLREVITGFKYKLTENTLAKERIKEKQSSIDAQKVECHRWEKLHGLIGSSDGKKYRNFAQGLTFELMVSHANRRLEKMTDRYLLVRDDAQPLELSVVDNYQAGEIRSTKNLSGGESFIVSLTLALGLSKMSSKKVRVDSLFLDEGFGTLDEDALDTALEVLSGLHQEGKLIGVISHVPALKERISCQLQVLPSHGGKSYIEGPGCASI